MKKKLSCLLALLLMVTSILGSTTVASAANGNARGGGEPNYFSLEITEITTSGFSKEGYYPASLEYALRNLEVHVSFEKNKSDDAGVWYYNYVDNCYCANGYGGTYTMLFYTKDGTLTEITDESVPVGEYDVIIQRRHHEEKIPIGTLKILDPTSKMQTPEDKKAYFRRTSSENFDEAWFSLGELVGDYAYYGSNFGDNLYWFASIWTYENGVAKRKTEGTIYDQGRYNSFSYEHSADLTNPYLVVGASQTGENTSVDMQWRKKKELTAIKLQPETSYKMWNDDFSNLPVQVTYSDGSKEIFDKWINPYDYEYTMVTANDDILKLNMQVDNQTEKSYSSKYWKPGTTSWVASVKGQESIKDTATILVESPTIQTIDSASTEGTKYATTTEHVEFYTYNEADKNQKIEILNDGPSKLTIRQYYRSLGSDKEWTWTGKSFIVSEYQSRSFLCSDSREYLFVLLTDSASTGEIGTNVSRTSSATIKKVVST